MAIAEASLEKKNIKEEEKGTRYGYTVNRVASGSRRKSKNYRNSVKSQHRRATISAKKRKAASVSLGNKMHVPYVKAVQSAYQNSSYNRGYKEIEEMSFTDLLDASHVLSIAQNERAFNLNKYSEQVKSFVQKVIGSENIDKYLSALNQQIVLRVGKQG